MQAACPHLSGAGVVAGIYSPCDRQIAPKALTQALVKGAQQYGAEFIFNHPVQGFDTTDGRVTAVTTAADRYPADAVVITAGLGSTALGQTLGAQVPLGPVLGQGIRVRVPAPLGNDNFQPVINSHDVHLVPLGGNEYGVAATVEFPTDMERQPQADPTQLEAMWQTAVAYCPALAHATQLEQWQGLRPRPQGRAAPIVEPLTGHENVLLATGHYRNGVFLAPATAQQVQAHLLGCDPRP